MFMIDKSAIHEQVNLVQELLLDDISNLLAYGSHEDILERYTLAVDRVTDLSQRRLSVLRKYIEESEVN